MMLIGARNAILVEEGVALPYDAEVEYLGFVDGAYIDTGIIPTGIFTLSITASFTASAPSQSTMFSAGSDAFVLRKNSQNIQFNGDGWWAAISTLNDTNAHTYRIESADGTQWRYSVDGGSAVASSVSLGALSDLSSLLLGRRYVYTSQYGGLRVYHFSYGSALDLIPVRVGTVGYLYDRVSGRLFGNAGTGAFVVGPDLSAQSYVQNGLVAMWDGIENAGWGKHEDNPDKFVDLVSGIAFIKYQTSAYSAFTSNALRGATYFSGPLPAVQGIFAGAFTVEDCVTRVATTGTHQGGTNLGIDNWFQLGAIASGRTFIRYRGPGVKYIYLPSTVPYTYVRSCAVGEAGGALDLSFNGEFLSEVQPGDMTSYKSGYMYLGTGLSQINYETVFPVLTHCIRFYNRALTAAEIAHNYIVDKARFNLT